MGYPIKKAQTTYPLLFLMLDSSDHVSPKTGLSPTVTLSKAGASFASPAGAVSEIGSGWYQVAGNATDSGTLGPLILHAEDASADDADECFPVLNYDPFDGHILDLAAGVETGLTVRQLFRLLSAVAAGKINGAGTANINIRDINDTKNRISATEDVSGNRSVVATDLS